MQISFLLPAAYLVTLASVALRVVLRPHEILRPSLAFCLLMVVTIGPAAAFCGPELDAGYREGGMLRLLAVVFPLGVLGWLALTPQLGALARQLSGKCRAPAAPFGRAEKRVLAILACVSAAVLAIYLQAVPLGSTGLVVMFTNPAAAAEAREESLSLVSSSLVKYAFTLYVAVGARLLVGLLVLWRTPWTSVRTVVRAGALLAVFAAAMLTGARSPAANLVLVWAAMYVLRKGIGRGGAVVAAVACLLLVSAAALTRIREGNVQSLWAPGGLSAAVFGRGEAFDRFFVAPLQTGVWTSHYVQKFGPLGIRSIRPLAVLCGREYFNLPHAVAQEYAADPIPTATANTCFLFDFQASFGLLEGWLLSLVLLGGLDFALCGFGGLEGRLLVAFLAAFLTSLLALVSGGFTVSLLTHGVLVIPLLAVGFTVWNRYAAGRRGPRWGGARPAVLGGSAPGQAARLTPSWN